MKRHELLFGFLRVPVDMILVLCSFFVAREIRMRTDLIPNIQLPTQTIADNQILFLFAFLAAFICVAVFAVHGLYRIQISHSKIKEILSLIHLSFLSFFVYIGLVYLANDVIYDTQIPRLLIVFAFLIALLLMIISRIVFNYIQSLLVKRGFFPPRNIILCLGHQSLDTIMKYLNNSVIYNIVGYTSSDKIDSLTCPYLGKISELEQIISSHVCDELFFLDVDLDQKKKYEIFDLARTLGVAYKYIGNTFELSKNNTDIYLLGDVPLVEIHSVGLGNWGRIIKRSFDAIVGTILFLLLSPVIFLFGAIASIQSRSTPFYTSKRIGKNGASFSMYKIRSMVANAEILKKDLEAKNERKDGPLFKIENDPRITSIGKFIRRWDIDELPQLLNVIKGDMSLIGPRPHLSEEIDQYEFWQKRLLTIKPGITGMAQVHGRHTNTFERECRLDLFYIENWSLLLDLKILFKTVRTVLFGK